MLAEPRLSPRWMAIFDCHVPLSVPVGIWPPFRQEECLGDTNDASETGDETDIPTKENELHRNDFLLQTICHKTTTRCVAFLV